MLFETWSPYVVMTVLELYIYIYQASFELVVILHLSFRFWDYKSAAMLSIRACFLSNLVTVLCMVPGRAANASIQQK